ncbi:MAG: ECF transporter S component [Clostridia bacterium]|nr:ECF transporter S component [Clostridia bacterium]
MTNTISVKKERGYKLKMLATLGMLAAMAYVITFICRVPIIPSVPFLDLEFKSAIILIGGFIYGPLPALAVTIVVCFLEMLTFSSTGFIGFVMNVLATAAFVCPAAFVYKKKKSLVGAIIGLSIGTALMTGVMLLWNYLVTPMYMHIPREQIMPLLLPAFLPFNVIKGALNSSITLVLYKFVVSALRKAKLLPQGDEKSQKKKTTFISAVILSALVIITCVLVILAFNNVF